LAEILENATARVVFHGWDQWNQPHYTLALELPLELFARVEAQLDASEASIQSKISTAINKKTGTDLITRVAITPAIQHAMETEGRPASETDAQRLWDGGMYRLFISHVATHKKEVAALKYRLAHLGISGFVAHEDIEPTLEWEQEIALALRSMHGMAVLLTPEFHQSKWTDQEVGAAMARGVMIIPVRLGLDPYGFMSKLQALRGDLNEPTDLAAAISEVLTKRPAITPQMREVLVVALEQAPEYVASIAASKAIVQTGGFTEEQLKRIEGSIANNPQVSGAYLIPGRLRKFVQACRGRPEGGTG
jgi:hypothetical protein